MNISNNEGKNVLVLNFDDHAGGGVIWTSADELESNGFNVFRLPLIKTLPSTSHFFVDVTKKYSFNKLLFKLKIYFGNRRGLQINYKNNHCFFSKGQEYTSAKHILNKTPFKPNLILIGWFDYYLSSKTIYDLYLLTGAKIVISMIDGHILGGGCHYPFECTKYLSGCEDCPSLMGDKRIARNVYEQKNKYWTNLPIHILATSYDLDRTKEIPFFNKAIRHTLVGVPKIPFKITKNEARQHFGISENDFVIMGAMTSLADPRKGCKELFDAINMMADKVGEKRITLLLLGNGKNILPIHSKVNVVLPGYLDKKGLYTAYYACDVFTSPSLDDSGPYTVNYCIACGRPLVAFPVGVALDLVIPQKTGYLAKYKNTEDFAKGILYFSKMDETELSLYERNCSELMEKLGKDTPWYAKMLD